MRLSNGLLCAALLTACAAPAAGKGAAGQIAAQTATVSAAQLVIAGTTDLPDDVCLLTAVVYGTALLPDWPTDCVAPRQGSWVVTVPVGEKGQPPMLQPGRQYEFQIWLRDHPETSSRLALTPAGTAP